MKQCPERYDAKYLAGNYTIADIFETFKYNTDYYCQSHEGDEAAKKKGGDGDAKPACANDVAIVLRQANPKRPGSQSHARYEKYKAATTRSEFRLLGGSSADFKYDLAHGFCSRVF